jgi:hypothetical protein
MKLHNKYHGNFLKCLYDQYLTLSFHSSLYRLCVTCTSSHARQRWKPHPNITVYDFQQLTFSMIQQQLLQYAVSPQGDKVTQSEAPDLNSKRHVMYSSGEKS